MESNNNFLYVSLPSNLEYIILMHDVLNNIRKRRTSVLSQIIEPNIDENLIDNYSYISKSPNKYATLDVNRNKNSVNNFSQSGSNFLKNSNNSRNNNNKNLNISVYEDKENNMNLSNLRSNCNKSYIENNINLNYFLLFSI